MKSIEDVQPGRVYTSRGKGLQTYEVLDRDDTCIAVRIKGHSEMVTISAFSFPRFKAAVRDGEV
jgi:hypothetical protein